jgi:hypothetical protein
MSGGRPRRTLLFIMASSRWVHAEWVRRLGGGLLLLAGATTTGTGCSFFLTQGPPPKAQRTPGFQCTESPRVPIADIAMSVLSIGEMFHAAATNRTPFPWLGAAVVFGASGGIGAGRVNACNKAHGHPYSPHAPAGTPGMMPEDPFGMKGARPGRPPAPDEDDVGPEREEEATEPAAPPPPPAAGASKKP